jgi:ferredoxin
MPHKYHINTRPTPARFSTPARSGIVDWEEGCLRCAVCVKEQCVYGAFKSRGVFGADYADRLDQICRDCFRCVQGCPARLIHKTVNPNYESLGNDYWTPRIVWTTWYQAETGMIPVSGAGYGGPFTGPGFDGMWTDMSEIVRPTRDGIHGREYISTSFYYGGTPRNLTYDAAGAVVGDLPRGREVPLPIVFDRPPMGDLGPNVRLAMAEAARVLDTMMVADSRHLNPLAEDLRLERHPIIVTGSSENADRLIRMAGWLRKVELADEPEVLEVVDRLRRANPDILFSVRVLLDERAAARTIELCQAGLDAVHLQADLTGRGFGRRAGIHIRDLVREVHQALVEKSLRDRICLLAAGGIALAEHVAKVIACGADAALVDLALMVALECRLCDDCNGARSCPVEIRWIDPEWGAQRIVNLMGAWRNQMLEVLGAMGLREARRLRGEVGRAMFFEDLEEENFAPIFGRRKQ